MDEVTVLAPAKINLVLLVGGGIDPDASLPAVRFGIDGSARIARQFSG